MIEEFFLIYKDYACTKGSGDLPDFLIFFMKLRNSCMFSKLSEMTIFRSCSMNFFFGNFGGTESGTSEVLKIIV